MSLRQPRDGRPTGVKGRISAESMRDALGLGTTPREGKVPDTPAQARLRASGRHREADELARDDYAVTILSPSEQYEAWGSPELAAPPGSPDGTPVPLPPPKSEAARQARHPDGAAPPSPEETAAEEAERIRQAARADIERTKARVKAAIESGTPEEREAAIRDGEGAVSLARRVKEKLGL